MWGVIISAVLALIPGIVQAVETLFANRPKSGTEKLNASVQLVLQGLAVGHIIDPQHIGQPETDLATEISNAIVKYNNARGIFTHAP
jgi:hypothetical protein